MPPASGAAIYRFNGREGKGTADIIRLTGLEEQGVVERAREAALDGFIRVKDHTDLLAALQHERERIAKHRRSDVVLVRPRRPGR